LSNALLASDDFQEVAALNATADSVGALMRRRRSIRSYLPEPIPKAELKALFDVVRYAPTSNNSQSLWWIVTTGPEQTRSLGALAREWLYRTYRGHIPQEQWPDDDPALRFAPHVAVCCGPEQSQGVRMDAAIAMTHLDLLAASRGIGTCWAGVFMRAVDGWPELADALALPEGQIPLCAMTLGRPRHGFRLVPPRKPSAVDWR
jgi:nitroreductase